MMDIKSNDSTPQRPEGERMLNAPLVEMDLTALIVQLKGESTWMESDRNSMTIFKSDTLRLVLIALHENAELKPHKADGVISVQVLEGNMEFTADSRATQMEKGQMIVLQANITHSVKALTEGCFLLTMAMNPH